MQDEGELSEAHPDIVIPITYILSICHVVREECEAYGRNGHAMLVRHHEAITHVLAFQIAHIMHLVEIVFPHAMAEEFL